MLNKQIFEQALQFFNFDPDIDCFATRANTQLQVYASRYPDPFATYIDSFTFNWKDHKPYIFPPFTLIHKVLQKIRVDKATALGVFPKWTTQAWWPLAQDMMLCEPLVLTPDPKNLVLPNKKGELHPLHAKLGIIICLLSGKNTDHEDILIQPLTSS